MNLSKTFVAFAIALAVLATSCSPADDMAFAVSYPADAGLDEPEPGKCILTDASALRDPALTKLAPLCDDNPLRAICKKEALTGDYLISDLFSETLVSVACTKIDKADEDSNLLCCASN